MSKPFISLTSDFGVQSQGVGNMHGVVLAIAPDANVIHLMHGLPEYDITAAARTLETATYLPIGFHVCVCDPGVGSTRKALIIKTYRGDCLIGPDNGVLIPASRRLGGVERVHEIVNPHYMRQPVSPIFHGRDVFAPAAAHLAMGVSLDAFGPALDPLALVPSPYNDAEIKGDAIHCTIIQINRFGSMHLNMVHEQWDALNLSGRTQLTLVSDRFAPIVLPTGRIFSDVPKGECVILKDDYGRVEVAKNMGSFVATYPFKIGEAIIIK